MTIINQKATENGILKMAMLWRAITHKSKGLMSSKKTPSSYLGRPHLISSKLFELFDLGGSGHFVKESEIRVTGFCN